MTRHSETLARIPLFRELDENEVRDLDTRCIWRRYDAKQEILGYGDDGTDVYFVLTGRVRVCIRSPQGREVIVADIDAGDFFGDLAAIDGAPRSASIVALTGVTVAKMPARVFKEMLDRHPDVSGEMMRRLAGRLRELLQRFNEFGTLKVSKRIYAELLRMSRPRGRDSTEAVISPPPYHAEIAARISTRREAVTRELSKLERQGLVEKGRGALVLRDPEALARLIEQDEDELV
ncbi:MAG: Crp/Fnr family transcriptional regulator [Alphaproteobacteria bacterium]|nr:Crp/Fnr family transcriptional regulator [Alphaproteobacteria bacterium]